MEKILWLASPTDSTLASSRAQGKPNTWAQGSTLDFAGLSPKQRGFALGEVKRSSLLGLSAWPGRLAGQARRDVKVHPILAELALGGGGEVCPSARLAQAASLPPLALSEVPIGHR